VRLGTLTGGHTGPVRATSFSPTGGILATASTDKTVRLWDLDPDHVFRRLCGVPAGALSPREWRTYLPEIAYRPVCD
jgi:WD40 repeat protein